MKKYFKIKQTQRDISLVEKKNQLRGESIKRWMKFYDGTIRLYHPIKTTCTKWKKKKKERKEDRGRMRKNPISSEPQELLPDERNLVGVERDVDCYPKT